MATMKVHSRRGQDGQAIIELALTLPLLLLVVFGVFDFGFMFQRYEVVTNAAREGARVGVLTGYAPVDAQNRALAYMTAGGIPMAAGGDRAAPCTQGFDTKTRCASATQVNVTLPAIPPATSGRVVQAIQVEVQYDYTFQFVGPLLTLFGGNMNQVRLRAVSTMRLEP